VNERFNIDGGFIGKDFVSPCRVINNKFHTGESLMSLTVSLEKVQKFIHTVFMLKQANLCSVVFLS